jgi:hypothetical protein
MTVLSFTVVFHSPFRVGSAYARDGVDAPLDQHDPLPPDHLKGMMRAAATDVLNLPQARIGEVFGSTRTPSPWSWSSAAPPGKWDFSYRHRVRIDPDTHSALKDHVVLGEQAWSSTARFEVSQAGAIQSDAAQRQHVLVLRCSAAAVHGLGAWRRRGLGWIGITPDDGPVTAADVTELRKLAEAAP